MPVQAKHANSVSNQYAREQEAMVYGKYKENGYQVNPLVSQAGGTLINGRVSAAEAFRIANADFKVSKTLVQYHTPASCLDEVMRVSRSTAPSFARTRVTVSGSWGTTTPLCRTTS